MENTTNKLFIVDINTLFAIYGAGFNHGANEGPLPSHGTFTEFHNVLDGKPLMHDGDGDTYPQVKQGIRYKIIEASPEEMSAWRNEAIHTLKI